MPSRPDNYPKIEPGLGIHEEEVSDLLGGIGKISRKWRWNIQEIRDLPGFIGDGSCYLVFRSQLDPDAVIKLGMASIMYEPAVDKKEQLKSARRSVTAMQRGQGLEHTEQLRAFRLEQTPVLVTDYVDGKIIGELASHEFPTEPEPYNTLALTWRAMGKRKIMPDEGPENIKWTEQDFTVIDYLPISSTDNLVLESAVQDFATYLPRGDGLSPSAQAFRDVCRMQFGKQVALEVEDICTR